MFLTNPKNCFFYNNKCVAKYILGTIINKIESILNHIFIQFYFLKNYFFHVNKYNGNKNLYSWSNRV